MVAGYGTINPVGQSSARHLEMTELEEARPQAIKNKKIALIKAVAMTVLVVAILTAGITAMCVAGSHGSVVASLLLAGDPAMSVALLMFLQIGVPIIVVGILSIIGLGMG